MRLFPIALIILLSLLFSSCANYRLNYAAGAEDWQTQQAADTAEVTYTLYLIGDIGDRAGKNLTGLDLLARHLRGAGEETGVIFLGNNLSKNHRRKEAYEGKLKDQLDIIKDFPGDLFFLPGESDWAADGLEGIEWQKDFIEDYLDREDVWMPDAGCSGPEEVELTDDLVLLLVDSEWYLRDWEGEIDINSDCEVKSRKVFRWLVNEEMKSNRHKNTVVAMHHPILSYGPHGGSHHWKDHIFPLTAVNDNLYIPLPIVGSLATYLRASIGNRRDIAHPVYQEMVDAFMDPARQNGRYIFAGAHDESLQYIERDSQVFIVSGGGSGRVTPSHTGKGADFSYSRSGFSRIHFYADGSAWVEFWATQDEHDKGKLVYRKQIKGPFPERVDQPEPEYEPIAPGATIRVPVSERDYEKGGLWRFFFGEHYRDVYKAEIEVPLFDLEQYRGGVEPIKRGGGAQTNSLRIEDESGRQYTLRSIDKDASRTVPYPFNQNVVLDIVEDNFSASHPFGALAAAELSKIAGIYHNNPKVVYLPRQAALGEYNDDYAEALYLLEERPDDEVWQDAEYFGNPEKIESTDNMLEEIRENHDHLLDDEALVYARLFDMLLGDWDRHDDQWRWGRTDEDSVKVYHPIPRDRDQVFGNYDGFAGVFIRQTAANSKQFKPFRDKIRNTKWENYNGRYLDQSLLTGLEWKDWEAAAKRLQETLTDEKIDEAVRRAWPGNIYALDGRDIVKKLQSRRNQLLEAARERYLFLARKVDVTGTDKKDLFEITQLDDGQLRVRVYDTNSDHEREMLFYERTFLRNETKEIRIYGLDDDDVFVVKGNGEGGPRINLIGGLGEDTYENEDSRLALHIYDSEQEDIELKGNKGFVKHLSDDPVYNLYDRRSHDYEYDFGGYFPSLGYNPEDGILLGLAGKFTTYGFKRSPFAGEHTLNLRYALSTSGIILRYKGDFTDAVGLWDLRLELDAQTPLYTNNYYGMGNNTQDRRLSEDEDNNYHRVRLSRVAFRPALVRRYQAGADLSIGPIVERLQLERTAGRYIAQIADDLPADIFDAQYYAGVHAAYKYRNQDDSVNPARGLALEMNGGWKKRLGVPGGQFPFLDAAVSIYQRLEPSGRVIFATRAGIDHRFNNRFEFFQAATIGGSGPEANFRGLRRDRYSGRTAFYHNIDLRVTVLESEDWGLPMSMGILAGFDHGRVWSVNGENRNGIWHKSYGGGVWLSPGNLILLNFSLFRSVEQQQALFTFTSSFFF
jgi:hypothetical protein